jgi:hypothetical protein
MWAHILVTGKIFIKGCPRVQYLALSDIKKDRAKY